jgi:hypothetical protein
MSQPATDGQDAPEVVEQFAKALTTKGTKVHEGNRPRPKAFVVLRVLGSAGLGSCMMKVTDSRARP